MGSIKHVRRSFTMVELMAAMAIIAILAGLGVKGMQFANSAAAEAATEANIAKVKIFLEDFKKLRGYYPQQNATPVSGTEAHQLQIELSTTTDANYLTNDEKYRLFKDYTELVNSGVIEATEGTDDGSGGTTGGIIKFMDGYGGYLYYKCPGIVNMMSYDLISAGSDGYFVYDSDTTYDPDTANPSNDEQGNWDNITSWGNVSNK